MEIAFRGFLSLFASLHVLLLHRPINMGAKEVLFGGKATEERSGGVYVCKDRDSQQRPLEFG